MASSPMEFWGIEVKAGQPIKADPGADYVIHLSQASLGESKNKAESVPLFVNVDGKKLGLGTLSSQSVPQLGFDLVFEKEFELSHNWKNGSVFFLGYKSYTGGEEGDDFGDMYSDDGSSDEEEAELPVVAAENGKAKADAKPAKTNAAKQTVKIAEPSEDDDSEDDDSDDEDDSDDDDSDEMSMDDSSDEEGEETPKKGSPKKVESSKKRPAEAATPASTKKAKAVVTPQKTDGRKGGHTATPHPAKQGGKNSAKTPKSGGQFSCSPCNKSFGSEGGLNSHKKAKHGGK